MNNVLELRLKIHDSRLSVKNQKALCAENQQLVKNLKAKKDERVNWMKGEAMKEIEKRNEESEVKVN